MPAVASTIVTGVSASGNEITGAYTLPQGGPAQGFLATVPEPSTLVLMGFGILGWVTGAMRVRDERNMAVQTLMR